jgi:transcription initiation factor TFIIB
MNKLMNKLKHLTDLNCLSETDIEFLTCQNSMINSTPNFLGGVKTVSSASDTEKFKCSFCNESDSILKDSFAGTVICTNCGHVIDSSTFDHGPEWKTYDDGGVTNNRCGMPTNSLLPQSSLGTTISNSCNYRLKTLHNWGIMPPKERSLNTDLNKIKKICHDAKLLNCIEDDAKLLYKIASDCKGEDNKNNLIIRGSNRVGLMAACIFYACKRRGYAKNHKEIAKLCELTPSQINKGCKKFIQCVKYKNIDYNTNISHPVNYIKQFCEKLNIHKKFINDITDITEKVTKLNIIPSHKPISIAAACILLCIQQYDISNIEKRQISEILGISEVTISKAYEKIEQNKDLIFNDKKVTNFLKQQDIHQSNLLIPNKFLKRLEVIKQIEPTQFTSVTKIQVNNFLSCNIVEHMIQTTQKCLEYTKNSKEKSHSYD